MLLLIASALVCADPAPTPRDRAFAAAVESWIPPTPPADPLIAQMGEHDWRRREAAQKTLTRRMMAGDRAAFRELIRAERGNPDPEIRMRAGLALAEITRCRVVHVPGYYGTIDCPMCGGTGDVRFSGWDDDGRLVPREVGRAPGL